MIFSFVTLSVIFGVAICAIIFNGRCKQDNSNYDFEFEKRFEKNLKQHKRTFKIDN